MKCLGLFEMLLPRSGMMRGRATCCRPSDPARIIRAMCATSWTVAITGVQAFTTEAEALEAARKMVPGASDYLRGQRDMLARCMEVVNVHASAYAETSPTGTRRGGGWRRWRSG